MLLLNAVLSQYATFVDERVCDESADYKALPESDRIMTIIKILEDDGRAFIQELYNVSGRETISYAEFMGEVEEMFPSAYDLPLRPFREHVVVCPRN